MVTTVLRFTRSSVLRLPFGSFSARAPAFEGAQLGAPHLPQLADVGLDAEVHLQNKKEDVRLPPPRSELLGYLQQSFGLLPTSEVFRLTSFFGASLLCFLDPEI